jgi:hypothetical protein
MKVVKFNNVRWPLPCSCSDRYAFIPHRQTGRKTEAFQITSRHRLCSYFAMDDSRVGYKLT